MIRRVLLAAILAGIAAGLVMSLVQQWRVSPLILEAEKYEHAPHEHLAPAPGLPAPGLPATTTAGQTAQAQSTPIPHEEEAEDWAPQDGIERILFTVTADLLAGIGFALLMAAASMLSGVPVTPANGALWGLAGFAVFMLAPSAGLPPELPGMPAGDLAMRQIWWWSTALATAGGIACLALGRHSWVRIAGIAVMAVPHLIGAPQPDAHDSAVPAGLANSFAASTIVTSAIFWMVLGVTLGYALRNVEKEQPA